MCKRATERAQAQIGLVRLRFESQLAELLERAPPLSEERFAQEVALLVGKADVREELDRLTAHIAQARSLLKDARPDNPVGRKFDFLCQEFNREANTLCSKSADIELTRIGIDLKGAACVRLNGNGEIVEERRYYDVGTLLRQLGLMPEQVEEPAAARR